MTKLGTCKWAYQIQEMWRLPLAPDYSHPHKPAKDEHIALPERYTCDWLRQHLPLPPPIMRMHGGFMIRDGDCDSCDRYEPASNWSPKS